MAVQLETREINGVSVYKTKGGRWEAFDSTVCTIPWAGRHYADSRTGIALPSVSVVLGMEPAPGLHVWKQKNVARAALDHIDVIAHLERDAAVNYLYDVADRNEAAAKGTEFHDFAETMILGESVSESSVPERVRPHYRHFADFLNTVQPELHSAEQIAWNEELGYAGSYDWLGSVKVNPDTRKFDPHGEPHMVIGDYKTGKKYPKVAKQLLAYALADTITDFDGNTQPMPEINGAVVVYVNEEGWDLRPVDIGPRTQAAFLADLEYYKAVEEWNSTHAGIIGRSWAKSATGRKTGTARRTS